MDAGTYVWAYMQTDEGTDELAYVCAHTVGWMSGRSDGCTQACTADLYELVTTPEIMGHDLVSIIMTYQ